MLVGAAGAAGAAVSTVSASAGLTGLTLPAASVALVVIECAPSASAVVGVTLHEPSAATTAVPRTVAPSITVMVEPASAEPAAPAKVGLLSLLAPLAAIAPVTGATSSVTVTPVGAAGAAVSTVSGRAALWGLSLPAASVALVVIECAPSASAVVGVTLHEPSAATTAVPRTVAPSITVMVEPASAEPAAPAKVGLLSLLAPLAAIAPVTGATSSVTVTPVGAAGAAVSTVSGRAALWGLSLPAASVSVVVIECAPSASGVVGVSMPVTGS